MVRVSAVFTAKGRPRARSAFQVAEELPIASAVGLVEWEEHELNAVQGDATLPDTQRQAIVLTRRGQGLFKKRVMTIEHACRITGINREEHLCASHCKQWRDPTNEERLDGENGLLSTSSIDHLFDRGFIAFEDDGQVIDSPVAHHESVHHIDFGLKSVAPWLWSGVESAPVLSRPVPQPVTEMRAPSRRKHRAESGRYGIREAIDDRIEWLAEPWCRLESTHATSR